VKLVQRTKGGQAEAAAEIVFTSRISSPQPTALKWPLIELNGDDLRRGLGNVFDAVGWLAENVRE
jgi:hypothetical protein